jgi:CO dehydrogenase maturation factor
MLAARRRFSGKSVWVLRDAFKTSCYGYQESERNSNFWKKETSDMTIQIKRRILEGRKIGFFGKGDSGKSTAVVLIGRALAAAGYTVCIVDADSTNIGLHQALGIAHPPLPLIDYFGGMVFSGGRVTCPVDDPTPLEGAPNIYLLAGGKLGEWGAGAGCDGPISKIVRDVDVRFDAKPVVTLVDFKAGFEDTARGVVTRLDWAIVVVDPTQASLIMAGHMKKMVKRIRDGQLPATKHLENAELVTMANRLFQDSPIQGVLVVLNKVANQKTEAILKRQLAEQGIKPIGIIHDDPKIGQAWLTGTEFPASVASLDIEAIMVNLENIVADATAEV